MVTVRCEEYGFDCEFTASGSVEEVTFDYWDHMSKEHGIEYSLETLAKYVKKKIQILPI